MGLSRIGKVAAVGATIIAFIPLVFGYLQTRHDDSETFSYLTPCSANVQPSFINENGNDYMTYSGVEPGIPILFPASSGSLVRSSVLPGEKHGKTLETAIYDTPEGLIQFVAGSGHLNFIPDPNRGDYMGEFTPYSTGLFGDAQIVLFRPLDSNEKALPSIEGCIR